MLGKRTHHIHRTSSMTQLRPPPSFRLGHPPASHNASRATPLDSKHSVLQEYSPALENGAMLNDASSTSSVTVDSHAMSVYLTGCTDTLLESSLGHHSFNYQPGTRPTAQKVTACALRSKQTASIAFMDACYLCKMPLGQGNDIFMYRGDAAFCSEECRQRQIAFDECQHSCSTSTSRASEKIIAIGTS
ncbi:hypothetical protein KP509_08G073400 [Ceratopteris richardii]|uniref:FLZ-type domain-containing protein n=1 Tax=Ceratopteris richardii TaxID=49495 RepID=A0A8T2U978_CERRI|nr:hypothetical protein KP509_08G073400 [Ceratopteris richardii]